MKINTIPEGFKDNVTSEVATEHKFKNIIVDHFQIYGFQLVKTPLIEYHETDTSKNVFKILENKNSNKLNVRDDITLQVARLSETRLSKKKRPLKLCYYGEVVRKEGTMLRPERQFLQIGAECIGESSFLADVEMIELAYESLSLVGIKKITVEVSSRIFFDKFISMIKNSSKKNIIKKLIKIKDLKNIIKILDKKDHQYIKNLFSCTGSYKNIKKNLHSLNIDSSTKTEILNIQNIINNFSSKNKNVNIFLDLCEVDNKTYHSGIRYTFFAENIRGEIARGGRYTFKNSNKVNIATGFTCYMDSILRASSAKLVQNKIILPFDTSKKKIKELIKKKYSLYRYTGSLEINKKLAIDLNCQFYLQNNSVKSI